MPMIKKTTTDEPDMTPMVDVTFLLLIFFMVTAAFTLQRSIVVPNPTSQLPSATPIELDLETETPILLSVDQYGGFLIRTDSWERELIGKQNLIRGLRQATQSSSSNCLEIAVESEARLQSMVDALDAGSIAGFEKIQITDTLSTNG